MARRVWTIVGSYVDGDAPPVVDVLSESPDYDYRIEYGGLVVLLTAHQFDGLLLDMTAARHEYDQHHSPNDTHSPLEGS